jgi:RNA polymerase sigma factor (sigma-70 family)
MQSYKVKDAHGRPSKIEVEVTDEAAEVLIELDREDEVWRRKHKRRELKGVSLDYLQGEYELEIESHDPTPQGVIEEQEERAELEVKKERLADAVACLDARQKEIVRLYYYESKNLSEIAAIFNTDHKNISRRLEVIHKKLKKLF